MDTNSALVLVTLALVVVTGVMAWATWRYADLTSRQLTQSREQESARALAALLANYGSPAMMTAVSMLWSLYRVCGGDKTKMFTRYNQAHTNRQRVLDGLTSEDATTNKDLADRLQLLDWGLDQQRRLVRAFYDRHDMLVSPPPLGLISPDVARNYWSDEDRKIMSDIVIPLEQAARSQRQGESAP